MTFAAVAPEFSGAIENTPVLFSQQAEGMTDCLTGEIGDELDLVYQYAREIAQAFRP